MSGSGRLPSLNNNSQSLGSATKPALKFKPKVVARKSKEERDASAAKIANAEKNHDDKKKPFPGKKFDGKQKARVPKHLANTHVITSGPLAAGNFSGEKEERGRGFTKTTSSEVSQTMQTLSNINDGDDDYSDQSDVDPEEQKGTRALRFNLGKEFDLDDMTKLHEEEDDDEGREELIKDDAMDEEADSEEISSETKKKIKDLFPLRPLRIAHTDLDLVQREIQNVISSQASRQSTPGLQEPVIKSEKADDIKSPLDANMTGLKKIILQREELLAKKIEEMRVSEFQSTDLKESAKEALLIEDDYQYITQKLEKLNNHPKKFMLFQLPAKLPEFKDLFQKRNITENKPEKPKKKEESKKRQPIKTEPEINQQKLPTGKIGSIRVHKSGKLTMKIGNNIMDVSRGVETTFLQDLILLDKDEEEPNAKVLGSIDARVVVTPKL